MAVQTVTSTRPADPRTHKTAASKLDPAELLAKVQARINSLEVIGRRGDDRDNVFAALREGRPVIPIKHFKFNGSYPPVGGDWHPGYEFIPTLAHAMEQPGHKRMVVTREFYEAGQELIRMQAIAQELAPLVGKVSEYKAKASQERAAQEAARLAEIAAKARAEQAEASLKAADADLVSYVGGLTFDI
jgi:hypothetical protein